MHQVELQTNWKESICYGRGLHLKCTYIINERITLTLFNSLFIRLTLAKWNNLVITNCRIFPTLSAINIKTFQVYTEQQWYDPKQAMKFKRIHKNLWIRKEDLAKLTSHICCHPVHTPSLQRHILTASRSLTITIKTKTHALCTQNYSSIYLQW